MRDVTNFKTATHEGLLGNPSNRSEQLAKLLLNETGWLVIRPTWPDFLAYNPKTDEVKFVEVKSVGDRLSKQQLLTVKALKEVGFKVDVMVITKKNMPIIIPIDSVNNRPVIPGVLHPMARESRAAQQAQNLRRDKGLPPGFDPSKIYQQPPSQQEIDTGIVEILDKVPSTKALSEEDQKIYNEMQEQHQREKERVEQEIKEKAAEAAAKLVESEESKSQDDLTPEVRATRKAVATATQHNQANPQIQEDWIPATNK